MTQRASIRPASEADVEECVALAVLAAPEVAGSEAGTVMTTSC